jgi:hypothetical protein
VSLLLNGSEKGLVDGLLVLDAVLGSLLLLSRLSVLPHSEFLICTHLRLLALLEERVLTRLVGSLVLGEVVACAGLLQNLLVYALQVDLGRGGDDIASVYSSQGNTVDFEGTGNEEDTLLEVLEDDDALATEATSEEDDDGAGLEGLADLCRADRLAGLGLELAMLHWCSCLQNSTESQSLHATMTLIAPNAIPILLFITSRTYLLSDGSVVSRVVLAGLLRVVRYRPLPLGELLGGGLRVLLFGRHFVFAVVVSAGRWCWRWSRIFVKSSVCQAVQSIRATG